MAGLVTGYMFSCSRYKETRCLNVEYMKTQFNFAITVHLIHVQLRNGMISSMSPGVIRD